MGRKRADLEQLRSLFEAGQLTDTAIAGKTGLSVNTVCAYRRRMGYLPTGQGRKAAQAHKAELQKFTEEFRSEWLSVTRILRHFPERIARIRITEGTK